jgi:hypothetical protein
MEAPTSRIDEVEARIREPRTRLDDGWVLAGSWGVWTSRVNSGVAHLLDHHGCGGVGLMGESPRSVAKILITALISARCRSSG